jgi:hypothetical protein
LSLYAALKAPLFHGRAGGILAARKTSGLKPAHWQAFIAALKRCASQNLTHPS